MEKDYSDYGFQPFFIELTPYPETEEEEPLAIIRLPFSRHDRSLELISEGTIYHDVTESTTFYRLGGVRALSFLSLVGPNPEVQEYVEFEHRRDDHSYTVARLGELVLRRYGFSEGDINTAIIAYLMHDIATPALGDATMKLDPENLSEEANFREIIGQREEDLFARYGTNTDEIEGIICNEGVLGQVLDVVDRITYTTKDLNALVNSDRHLRPADPNLHSQNDRYLQEILDVIKDYPNFGEIYKTVGVDRKSGQVFFSEPEMLSAFLHIRAMLHERLYLHPSSQGRDLFVQRLIEPFYSPNDDDPGMLTPQQLRSMTDFGLMQELEKRYSTIEGIGHDRLFGAIVNWYPDYERFETEDEANKRAEVLASEENTVVLGVKQRRGFNPGTGYNVIHPITRKVLPLREYDPKLANEPERIAASLPATFVYYSRLDPEDNWSPINSLLRQAPQFKTA